LRSSRHIPLIERLFWVLKRLCNEARPAGARRRMAESSFAGYLIEIGLGKYRNAILPPEQGQGTEGPENPQK
jgi:hypothetical protein